jgi:hypothetical protein
MHVLYEKPEWLGGLLFLVVVCFLAGVFCLINLPAQDPGIKRGLLRLAACLCFAAALVCLFTEDRYIMLHAPRVIVAGSVTTLRIDNNSRHGPYADFRVDAPAWEYYTFHVVQSHSEIRDEVLQPGDQVKMLVRLWDIKVETLDELSGSHPGWRYDAQDNPVRDLFGFALAVPILGYGILMLFQEPRGRLRDDDDFDSHDDGNSGDHGEFPGSEIQTLGLENRDGK